MHKSPFDKQRSIPNRLENTYQSPEDKSKTGYNGQSQSDTKMKDFINPSPPDHQTGAGFFS